MGTPVVTIGDGTIVKAGWNGGMGNYVEIRHNSIYASCYGHLSRYGKGVKRGRRVAQGQVVGYVGSTGLSTGPHLDFRIKKYNSYVNPLTLDFPRTDPVPEEEFAAFAETRDVLLQAMSVDPVVASAAE
jgi:murein DD-endopeptidase MepM/ murein hydrolase activator NlpD